MLDIICKKSLSAYGKNPWKSIPTAISNELVAFASCTRNNEIQVLDSNGNEVAHLRNHLCKIDVLCFGNNAFILASACEQVVNVWDLSENEPSCIQVGKALGCVSHLAFTFDDGTILSCISNEIWVIDIKNCKLVASITLNDGDVIAAEFCGKQTNLIIAINEGRTYSICDVVEGCLIYHSCIITSFPLLSLAMHPFEQFFAIGSNDGLISVYDLSLHNSLHQYNISTVIGKLSGEDGVGAAIINLSYWDRTRPSTEEEGVIQDVLKEELYLSVACTSAILLLNANTMEVCSIVFYVDIVLPTSLSSLSAAANVAFSNHSRERFNLLVTSLFSNEIHICQTEDRENETVHSFTVLSFEPLVEDSPLKADIQPKLKPKNDNKSKNQKKGKVDIMNQPLVFHGKIKSSGYTSDKPRTDMFQPKINKRVTKLASNNVGPWGLKGEVRSAENEYPLDSVPPTKLHSDEKICINDSTINCLSFSDSGKSLACGLSDHSALLVKTSTMKSAAFSGHNGIVNTALMNHSNSALITSSDDSTVKLWMPGYAEPILDMSHYRNNFKTDSVKKTSDKDNAPFKKGIFGAQFYYNDKFIMVSHGNSLLLYKYFIDPQKNDVKRYLTNNRYKLVKDFEICECQKVSTFSAINSFYSYVAICACSNRDLVVFDINRSQQVLTINDAHSRPVHSLCQNQGSSFITLPSEAYDLFITAAVTDGVKLWDLRVNKCVRKFEGHLSRASKVGLAYSPCSRFVAVGSEDNCCYVYDIRSVAYLHRLSGLKDVVTAVAFHPQKPLLACGTASGLLRTYIV